MVKGVGAGAFGVCSGDSIDTARRYTRMEQYQAADPISKPWDDISVGLRAVSVDG